MRDYYSLFAAGKVSVQAPSEMEVLPLDEAVMVLKEGDAASGEVVYEYWIGKRRLKRKPLLDELWEVFPWSVGPDACF